MKKILLLCLVTCWSWYAHGGSAESQVSMTLDAFHSAASEASEARYFALMTDDVVFLGTDGTERWQGQEFRDFVSEHFSKGRGWTYTSAERHIEVSGDGQSAWFDELLDNDKLGRCRGSGVLLLTDDGWKIAQYNLSIPVPNSLAVTVTELIQAVDAGGELDVEVEYEGDARILEVDVELLEGVESTAPMEDDATEEEADSEAADEGKKRCAKRHKTNRRADC